LRSRMWLCRRGSVVSRWSLQGRLPPDHRATPAAAAPAATSGCRRGR
jgi:hypothetical protein